MISTLLMITLLVLMAWLVYILFNMCTTFANMMLSKDENDEDRYLQEFMTDFRGLLMWTIITIVWAMITSRILS